MKIFNINLTDKPNNTNFSMNKSQKFVENSFISKHSTLKLNMLNSDTISFGKKRNKVPMIKDGETIIYHRIYNELKDIPNLPCGYCGEPMLSVPNRKRISNELSTNTGEDLINTIEKNKKFFRGHKIKVAQKVAEMAKIHPEDNIQELFQKLTPLYRSELEAEQMAVIRRIDALYGKSFESDEAKKIFQNILYETTQWIYSKNEDEPFKRKTFLFELKKFLQLPIFRKNKQLARKIYLEAEKLPQSIESENAFVVKYHRRSAKEISDLLLYEPMSTIEHIKTQDSGGLTSPENLAIVCARCNNYVRNNKPMDKFVDEHPEINKNLIKNFDAILYYSQKQNVLLHKKLSEKNIDNENYQRYVQSIKNNEAYKNYISAIAQTYMKESKGKLNLQKYLAKSHNTASSTN